MSLQLGSHGPLVSKWTDVMLARFAGYAKGVDGQKLRNDGYFGFDEQKVQKEYQFRTKQAVSIAAASGVVSDQDLGALGLALPVIFTVEGHMSNMWFGPTASVASQLQREDICYWQPVGYDCLSLPFKNASGVQSLFDLLSGTRLPDGTPFPTGTGWGIEGFSQGAMVVCEFMAKHVLPENGQLHWRLKDFKRGLCFGNPRREQDKVASWASNPANPGTRGIMDVEFVTTGTVLENKWRENAKHGDMFSENTIDKTGQDKTAIAKIVCENAWTGPAGVLLRLLQIIGNVPAEAIPAIKAAITAIMFLASNPNPHYATVAEPGDYAWMRGVAA
jgi:hypothetical protein